MKIQDLQEKLFKNGWPTPVGWAVLAAFILAYGLLKHSATERRQAKAALRIEARTSSLPTSRSVQPDKARLPNVPLPAIQPIPPKPSPEADPHPIRTYNQPSFGNSQSTTRLSSDDFLPKGTILYVTLTSDIVSNNQVSPATATVIQPAVFAHKIRIPVGTRVTGKIAPGNLRGRVFVNWDTIVFYDEGRQGYELPIKGIGMTYEQNEHSVQGNHHPGKGGRWIIQGAGLKGYVIDDGTANAFKLASLKAMEDFAKTLQTYVTTQNSAVSGGSVVTSTTTTPEATLQNSGLAFAGSFIDVIAQRYQAQLNQNSSYVLVPTARFCAIFLDEAIDLSSAAPGKTMSKP